MNLFYPAQTRFILDRTKKAWFEHFMAELITQCANSVPAKMLPEVFVPLKKAVQSVAYQTDIEYIAEARYISNVVVFGSVSDYQRKDHITAALVAIMFTCAAEVVNNRNVFTVGYTNLKFGIACENIIVDAKKRACSVALDMLMHENYTMIGNIARSFCNNEEIQVSVVV